MRVNVLRDRHAMLLSAHPLPLLRHTVPLSTCGEGAVCENNFIVFVQYPRLLQFRVFSFGLLVDRDVGVGVFPEGKEVQVRAVRLGGVAL